jgi:hypothetical protein
MRSSPARLTFAGLDHVRPWSSEWLIRIEEASRRDVDPVHVRARRSRVGRDRRLVVEARAAERRDEDRLRPCRIRPLP